MKVRLKSTGEIINVEKKGKYYIDNDNNPYMKDEVEEMLDEESLKMEFLKAVGNAIDEVKKHEIEEEERRYWRDVRKEILIELIRQRGVLYDITKADLVSEADTYVKMLKEKDR